MGNPVKTARQKTLGKPPTHPGKVSLFNYICVSGRLAEWLGKAASNTAVRTATIVSFFVARLHN